MRNDPAESESGKTGRRLMAHTFTATASKWPRVSTSHMVQLRKPEKAAKSFPANPERAGLMPKFLKVFSG